MNLSHSIRSLPKVALVASAFSGFALIGLAQPTPAKSQPSSSTAPVAPTLTGPTITASSLPAPIVQGVISADETKTYMAFQEQLNEDPTIKELNAKIAKLTKEIQQLRAESGAARDKLIAANPEIKKIQDKIAAAMHSRTSNGPMPMPSTNGPMPISTANGPMPQPGKKN